MQAVTRFYKASSTRKIVRYSIAFVAGILLVFIGIKGYNFYRLSPERLYLEQYNYFELTTARRDNEPGSSAIEKAYVAKEYQKVIDLKKRATKISIGEHFVTGLSYLELDDPFDAIHSFSSVISQDKASGKETYRDQAEFYLALAYLKNKDYDQALELMKNIHNDPRHLYHDKFSNSFIRKIKMLKWR